MTKWPRGRARRAIAAAAAACALGAAAAGCGARVTAAPSLAVTSAYVPLPAAAAPHTTVAFLDIRNGGSADRLVAARTSVGGTVMFRSPTGQDATRLKTVPSISIPGGTTVRLLPNSAHLLITGAGTMQGGKDITLILTFARAGTVSVIAQVTDPQSGGGSYFTN